MRGKSFVAYTIQSKISATSGQWVTWRISSQHLWHSCFQKTYHWTIFVHNPHLIIKKTNEMFNSSYNNWNAGWRFLFKVTDVKKTNTVCNMEIATYTITPSRLTWRHHRVYRGKLQCHKLEQKCISCSLMNPIKNGLTNHKLHSANQNWSYLSMNLLHHPQFCKLSNWKANSRAVLF